MYSLRELQRKSLYVGAFALAVNIFFGKFFGSFALALFTGFLFLLITALFFKKDQKYSWSLLLVAFILIIADVILLTRDNTFVWYMARFVALGMLSLYTYLLGNDRRSIVSLFELVTAPFRSVFQYALSVKDFIRTLFSRNYRDQTINTSKHLGQSLKKTILVGLVIAAPVLALLVSLLSKGDPIFFHYVKDILEILDMDRVFFTAFVFVIFLPLLFWKKRDWSTVIPDRFPFGKLTKEYTIVMSLVAITMAAFLIIQWRYIFASVPAEASLAQFGVKTYSEYVTKGFIELLQVAVLLYSLLWIGLTMLRRQSFMHRPLLFMQYIVAGEFVLFAISVLRRVHLYQTYHGLTLIRIYGAIFLLWLLMMIATLAARHFTKKPVLRFEIVFSVIVLFFIGSFNSEEFIAVSSPPTVNNKVDYIYLARQSADGYVGWKMAYDQAKSTLTDTRFDRTNMLLKDDRRDIAYAGYILWHTIRHYHDLTLHHGTDAEVDAYFNTVISSEQAAIENRVNAYKAELLLPDKTNAQKQLLKDLIYYEQDHMTRLNKFNKNRLAANKKAAEGDQDSGIILYPAQEYSIYGKASFENNSDYYNFVEPSFFEVNDYHYGPDGYFDLNKLRNPLSQAFAWNNSQIGAYKKIKEDISLEEILLLHNRYFTLWERIRNQPADEQKYDQDVSLVRRFID